MSHYEERLTLDLHDLRQALKGVAVQVGDALDLSVRAIQKWDRDLLYDVVIGDLGINREVREIDRLCHAFVARHLPAAGHLRFISSTLRLTIALERAGDYAVTISRVALQLEEPLEKEIVKEVAQLAEASRTMLKDAIRAFLEGNVELAQKTKRVGRRVSLGYERIFHLLIDESPRRPRLQLASLLTIFGKVERFCDQAKNICEEAVFAATGEMKAPKVFRVLFLDEHNDLIGQLAEGIAWKGFPDRGVFSSAGWNPHDAIHPETLAIAERFGLDLHRARPSQVTGLDETPAEYHVVVALNVVGKDSVPHIPYHTILQKWEVPVPTADEGETFDAQIDQTVRDLTVRINVLMERLSGRTAD